MFPKYTINRQCHTVRSKVNPEYIKTCLVDEEMDFHYLIERGIYFETVDDTNSLLHDPILPKIK